MMKPYHSTGRQSAMMRRAPRRCGGPPLGAAGFTLVEMLVALLVIGVVLTATASSLISFTQQSVVDERRVQATAVLTEVHEEFQALPWDLLATSPAELDGNNDAGESLDEPQHLGTALDLTEIDGWLALDDESEDPPTGLEPLGYTGPEGRSDEIVTFIPGGFDQGVDLPPAFERIEADERDGREYSIYRIVTWVPNDDGEPGEIKRLTAVARWEILGRTYEEVMVSERAPNVIETGERGIPRLIQFSLPNLVRLCGVEGDYAATPQSDLDVVLRFSEPVQNVEIRFPSLADPPTVNQEGPDGEDEQVTVVEMREVPVPAILQEAEDGGFLYFAASNFTDGFLFPEGVTTFTVSAQRLEDSTRIDIRSRPVTFYWVDPGVDPEVDSDGCSDPEVPPLPPPPGSESIVDDEVPDAGSPVDITNITVTPDFQKIYLYRVGSSRFMCENVTVAATLEGLEEDEEGNVTDVVGLNYAAGGDPASANMVAGTTPGFYSFTFEKDQDYEFRASGNASVTTTTFSVTVLRGTTEVASKTKSDTLPYEFESVKDCP